MAKDHIIPKFILKGFLVSPNSNNTNQKVMIFEKATSKVKTEKIVDAFTIRDFNSPETEKFLAYEYEDKVAKIFQKINKTAIDGGNSIILNNEEYKLLFRFFTIMWRRNNIQMDKAKELAIELEQTLKVLLGKDYENIINPEYKGVTFNELFDSMKDVICKAFYDKVIPETTDDDPTVKKTIENYKPAIIYNKSKIHFLLHNSYATLRYITPKEYKGKEPITDMPFVIIEPISNNLCFCLALCEKTINTNENNFEIPIEIWGNDCEIKTHFIDGYITPTATSFVVDDTNIELLKEHLSKSKN